jgi:hypothetical protein
MDKMYSVHQSCPTHHLVVTATFPHPPQQGLNVALGYFIEHIKLGSYPQAKRCLYPITQTIARDEGLQGLLLRSQSTSKL